MLGLLKDFNSLIYPHLCASCGKTLQSHENCICLYCKVSFPVTNFHLNLENEVAKIFWGRVKLHAVAAFCYFKKGDKMQHLIHELKYRGNTRVGVELAQLYGNDLNNSEWFKGVDYFIPVPLHPDRERKRGYNQAEKIADGFALSMQGEVEKNVLLRNVSTETQTKKSHYERWENVSSIFSLKNQEKLENKHVMIVDDVLTTGSTIEACVQELSKIKGITISVACLAYASN